MAYFLLTPTLNIRSTPNVSVPQVTTKHFGMGPNKPRVRYTQAMFTNHQKKLGSSKLFVP